MTLPIIAAYDQLAAALDALRPQMPRLLEVLALNPEQRVRISKAYGDIERAVALQSRVKTPESGGDEAGTVACGSSVDGATRSRPRARRLTAIKIARNRANQPV